MGNLSKILFGLALCAFVAAGLNSYNESAPQVENQTALLSQTETQADLQNNKSKELFKRDIAQVKAQAPSFFPPSPSFDTAKDTETKPIALQSFIDQNPAQLESLEKVSVNIEGKKILVNRSSYIARSKNNITWVGQLNGDKNSILVMSQVNGIFAGSIQTKDGFYTVEYNDKTEQYQMTKINRVEMGDDAVKPILSSDDAQAGTASAPVAAAATDSSTTNANKVVADIAMFYAKDTYSSNSGESAVIAKIQNGVELTNQAFDRSLTNIRLNLVLVKAVNYTSNGDTQNDLNALYKKDGNFDEALTLRNDYGADLMSLVVTSRKDNIIGRAYYPGNSTTQGTSVINLDYVATPMFSHEVGHNYGLAHQDGSAGSYAYGRPYQFSDKKWTTIMWSHYQGSKHIFNYSNPNVTHDSYPTGVENKYDEARAAQNKASALANFKASKVVSKNPVISSVSSSQNVLVGDKIKLNVSATGADLVYQWKKDGSDLVEGGKILGSKSSSLEISSSSISDSGEYQVLVSNADGSVLSSKIAVSVREIQAPIANAGADISIQVRKVVNLDASKSSDPQGYNLSYSWKQLSGPSSVSLNGANSAKASFTADAIGDYVFQVTASNGKLSSQDSLTVSVNDAPAISLVIELTKNASTYTKYETTIGADSTILNEIKSVNYHFYANGKYLHTQRSISKATKFRNSKMIKETMQIKAEVLYKDGSTIVLDGVIERLPYSK